MGRVVLSQQSICVEETTNLDAVTEATTGSKVDMRWYAIKSVFITVSGNTGAVTVNIEASHDGTNWFNVNSTTYTATNKTDIRSYASYFPFMRTTSTTQSSSTVSTVITGRS